ncbi:hypothetical protein L204_102051 [Cryptococcus depauperatus]
MAHTYALSSFSYSIPILHAAAHPSSTVIGLFLSSSTTTNERIVDDAIPLLHLYTSLSPMMEAALSLAEVYAKGKGKSISGIYVAREEGEGLGRAGERILASIRKRFDGAFALSLDNDKLAAGQFAYVLFPSSPESSSQVSPSLPSFTLISPTIPTELLKVIREDRLHRGVRDFDDHLDDSSCDWLENATVKRDLQKLIS